MSSRISRTKKSVDYSKFDEESDDSDDFAMKPAPKSEVKSVKSKVSKEPSKKKKKISNDDDFNPGVNQCESSDDTAELKCSGSDSDWEDAKPTKQSNKKKVKQSNKENKPSSSTKTSKVELMSKASIPISVKSPPAANKANATSNISILKGVDSTLPSITPKTPASTPTPRPLTKIKCFTPPARPGTSAPSTSCTSTSSTIATLQKTPGSGGLRLGLSRKQAVKPLHANVRLTN